MCVHVLAKQNFDAANSMAHYKCAMFYPSYKFRHGKNSGQKISGQNFGNFNYQSS
jgi:hypothetical protein